MATYYYNNVTTNGDIGDLANWWLDNGFTVPATQFPSTGDDIQILSDATINTGGNVGVVASMSVATNATFQVNLPPVLGPIVFHDAAVLTGLGNISSQMTIDFYDASSCSGGQISQASTLTFHNTALVDGGTIAGTMSITSAVFNDSSSITSGSISVAGNVIFNDSATAVAGTITTPTTYFNDTSVLNGVVIMGNVISSGSATSQIATGSISGNLTFTGTYTDQLPSINSVTLGGTNYFSGTVIFSGVNNSTATTWTDTGSNWTFTAGHGNDTAAITVGFALITGGGYNNGYITGSVTFDEAATNFLQVTGNVIFNGGATNSGNITGNVIINNGINNSTITGNVTFTPLDDSAQNNGAIDGILTAPAKYNGDGTWGAYTGNLGGMISLRLIGINQGINGSNILNMN